MASADATNYKAPECEDYHSDESDAVGFKGRSTPNAANVTKRRSDLDKEKPPQEKPHSNSDQRSDSGATSQQHPPAAPAPPPPPPHPASPAPAYKTRRPTLSTEDRRASNNSSPRPAPVSRTASSASRPAAATRPPKITQEPRRDRRESKPTVCTDPHCTGCDLSGGRPQPLRRRPELPPSASARDVSKPSADNRSIQSDPYSPPSPTYHRQSAYMQGGAVMQPAAPRRRGSSNARQRPMSYSGEPGAQYWTPGMPAPYPSPPQDHGPPPSASAYRNLPFQGMPPPSAPYSQSAQTSAYYAQQSYNQTSPPYENSQRPPMPQRNSSVYGTHGTRTGPSPIVTQQQPPARDKYSARYGQHPQSAGPAQSRFPAPLQINDQAYDSSGTESSGEEDQYEVDDHDPSHARALMPPPKIKRSKSKKERRPSVLRAKTTQPLDDVVRQPAQTMVVQERPGRERASSRTAQATQSRRMSLSRPALERQTQSAYDTSRAQVTVASTKASRRQSTQVYDKMYEQYARARAREDAQAVAAREEAQAQARLREEARAEAARAEAKETRARAREEAKKLKAREEAEARALEQAEYERRYQTGLKRANRNSKVVYAPEPFDSDSEEESEVEEPPPVLRHRRPTDVGKGKGRVVEAKSKRIECAVEDYISANRGSRESYADQSYKAAKKHSQIPSEPSHSGSSRSGSDKQSQSNRTAVTSNGSNEIRLRVDASAPLSLTFNGEMEGRTLQLVPAGDGMAEIVIGGSSRGEGSVYHASERGSVRNSNRRSLIASQARREAEEMTERSVHSSRSRRDGRVVRESQEIRDGWDARGPPVMRRHTEYRN
ncbi:hypothetical protein ACN47E_004586 [Coniothyrium glycines]